MQDALSPIIKVSRFSSHTTSRDCELLISGNCWWWGWLVVGVGTLRSMIFSPDSVVTSPEEGASVEAAVSSEPPWGSSPEKRTGRVGREGVHV